MPISPYGSGCLLGGKELFWPLTKRGLLSELVVASYAQSLCQHWQIKFRLFSSPVNIRYWKALFPSLDICACPFPSSYVSPVRGEVKRFGLLRLIGQSKYFMSVSIFNSIWSYSAESKFLSEFDLYSAVQANLTSLLRTSVTYEGGLFGDNHLSHKPFNAIHLRLGDKVYSKFAEALQIPLDVYAQACCENFSKHNHVYVMGDSPEANDKLADMLRFSGFQSVSTLSPCYANLTTGYDQACFNRLPVDKKVKYSTLFMSDFVKLVLAESVICTFSSNVGRSAALLRGNKNILSLGGDFRIVQ